MKAIRTEAYSIKKLFTDFEFIIPEFQRPYSWSDTVQCQTLWDDLTEFYDCNQKSESKWFLGSIVLSKNSSVKKGMEDEVVRYVVDGQQRLTTLFILLSVLKNKFNTYKGLGNILCPRDGLTDSTKPYARVRTFVPEDKKNAGMLYRFANENSPTFDAQNGCNNFKSNFSFFTDKLNAWIDCIDSRKKDANAYKDGFLKFLLGRVELLCIECEDEEDAFRVFEVVNDRGLELSAVQIIKPRLMQNLDDDGTKRFLEEWGRWTDVSEKKEDNNPLVSFLFQMLKEIRSVKKHGTPDYQKTPLSQFFKKDELKNVEEDISVLFAIHKWKPANDELYVLMHIMDKITSKTYKVALYAYFYERVMRNNKIFAPFDENAKETADAVKFCRDLVRFLYGQSLADKTSRDDIRKPCYDQVKWIFDKSAPYKFKIAKEDLKKIEFRLGKENGFEKENCYKHGLGTGLMLLASYLFARKSKCRKGRMEKLANLLRMGYEREHICPRKSGYAWATWDREVHDELVNSIGNLIPLEEEINLSARNNDFTLKRDGEKGTGKFRDQNLAVGYKKSNSPEASEFLATKTEWTPEDVRKFAEKKANMILKFLKTPSEAVE